MPKIEISIRRKRPATRRKNDHKGPVDIPREADYLKRRLRRGVIKIYDMGRKWNGSAFVDINFHFAPTYTHSSASSVWVGWNSSAFFTLSHHNDLRNLIIDYDLNNIASMHPQLGSPDDAYWFGLQLYNGFTLLREADGDPAWTNSGWAIPASELASPDLRLLTDSYNPNLFYYIQFGGAHPHKITNTYDPDASAVAFTLTAGDELFLMPVMTKPLFLENYTDNVEYPPGSFADRNVVDYLAADTMTAPRVPYLDPLNENYRDGLFDGYQDAAPVPSIYFEKRIRLIQSQGFNLKRERTFFVPAFGWQWEVLDPALYPDPRYDDSADDDVSTFQGYWIGATNQESLTGFGAIPHKALLGVVKRRAQLFFIWMN